MLSHPKVLTVGETGLDGYYLKDAPFEQQLQVFREHLQLACGFSKTLVIHCRGLNFYDILLADFLFFGLQHENMFTYFLP